ncbi:NAD-dependent protein deacetylase sirtuin-2 [Chytriomyces hyalinus]|nr:NAD-dependent protein deacetylase sirtuin-2 [Chytriomyces hyalinus]
MELTILFNEMEGFAVYPKTDCPHVFEHVGNFEGAAAMRLAEHAHSSQCSIADCGSSHENWVCLSANCVAVCCSRYVNGHMAAHFEETRHAVSLSFTDLSVFCYECDSYITHPRLLNALNACHEAKFGEPHPLLLASSGSRSGTAQASSSASGSTPRSRILNDDSIESFATYIQENNCRRILVLTGAGISTSAGIPDFRSPDTGLYATLEKYNLPTPESMFSIDFFRKNPVPFYTLAKEMYPGNYMPTPSHFFIKLLAMRKMLKRNYTQNIDNLERVAGVNADLQVESHGSFASATCVGGSWPAVESDLMAEVAQNVPGCGKQFTQEWVKQRIFANEIPKCDACNGLVKPDIVFFGEPLPTRFAQCCDVDFDGPESVDAVIIMGSSLKVTPFNFLHKFVDKRVPRLLINRTLVADFAGATVESEDLDAGVRGHQDSLGRDAVFLGDCDAGCLKLAQLLGMERELVALMEKGKSSFQFNQRVDR